MATLTVPQVLAHIGVSLDRFKGWDKRGLTDFLPETTQGVARTMTREASLALALFRYLVDRGVDPDDAKRFAPEFAGKAVRARELRPIWWFAPNVDDEPVKLTDDQAHSIPFEQLQQMFDERAGDNLGASDSDEFGRLVKKAHLFKIPMGEIVHHIDRLFA